MKSVANSSPGRYSGSLPTRAIAVSLAHELGINFHSLEYVVHAVLSSTIVSATFSVSQKYKSTGICIFFSHISLLSFLLVSCYSALLLLELC